MPKKTPVSVDAAQNVVKDIIATLVRIKKPEWVQASDHDIAMADHIIERAIDAEGASTSQGIVIHVHEKDLFHDDRIGEWAAAFLNRYPNGEKRLAALLNWRFKKKLGVSPWMIEHNSDLLKEGIHAC